jgi:hypothetical protein
MGVNKLRNPRVCCLFSRNYADGRSIYKRNGANVGIEEKKADANDGKEWSEMDIEDLKNSVSRGHTPEWVAEFLCRSGTIGDVRRKAEELGLQFRTKV